MLTRRAVLTSLALLLAVSCTGSGGISPTPKKKELVVGAVLSLTGGAAVYGSDADKGAQLAAEQFNAASRPFTVRYVAMDDKSDRVEATKSARALVEAQGAQVLLGPAISPSALSVGKYAQESLIPMIATSATQDEVTTPTSGEDRSYVFRVCFNDSYQGDLLGPFAAQELGLTTAGIVYDKTLSYSIGLAQKFRSAFEAKGGTILFEENYSVKDTDYSSLVTKVAQSDAQVLFIPGWDENVGPMLKQAGNQWDKFTLLGGDGWPSPRLKDLSGGNIRNAYAVTHFDPNDTDPGVRSFVTSYRARYADAEPTAFAALGYDAMDVLLDAASRAPDFAGTSLRDALQRTDLSAVTGRIRFDASRNPNKGATIVKMDGGIVTFFKRVAPVGP